MPGESNKEDITVRGRSRVFYVGMITPDSYGAAVGEDTYAGAAERKMLAVVRALRSVGQRALVVSLPFVGPRGQRPFYGPVVTSDDGIPAVFVATFRSKYFRKLLGPFFLAAYLQRQVKPGDTVILYNHAIEYLLSLVLLRLRRIRVVQDIEDVPTKNENGIRNILDRIGFAIIFRMTRRRKMVVADHVARGLGLADYVVIRGIAYMNDDNSYAIQKKWGTFHEGGALMLHFGGTLRPDTGVDLFCATVQALAEQEGTLARPVVFWVTGTGAFDKLQALRSEIGASSRVRLEIQQELSKRDYDDLIESCHASLSLRRPGAEYSNTTFPSKVIEITSRGLALVSTDRGDVSTIFDHYSAFLIDKYSELELVKTIISMVSNPELVQRVALAGRIVCSQVFAPKAVGEELKRLL